TYTIIGQGLIDQALSLRAEERRALFEEAAGVSHYQARRATTLRRLQETQHNIERVHDILAEIRPRLGALKRQANRARTYEQVEADLRSLLRIWYGYQWDRRRESLKEQRVLAREAEDRWSESREAITRHQENLARVRREIDELDARQGRLRTRREQLREKRANARREVDVLNERGRLLKQQIAETSEELSELAKQREQAQTEVDQALAALETARDRLTEQESRLERFNQGIKAQQDEIDRWTKQAKKNEEVRSATITELAQLEGQLAELKERLARQNGDAPPAEELASLETKIDKLAEKAATVEQQVRELQSRRRQIRDELDAARTEQQAQLRKQKQLNDRLSTIKERIARLESRTDLLDQMREQDLDTAVDVDVIGRLSTLVEFSDEHSTALEAALGARLGTLVVRDEPSLSAFLAAHNGSQTVFAAAVSDIGETERLRRPEDAEVIGWGDEFITTDDVAANVASLLFGPILLVRSRQAARRIGGGLAPGTMAVAPDGFIVHAGGLVEYNGQDARQSVLAREEAWRAAQAQLEAARSEADEVAETIADQQSTIEEQEKNLALLSRDEQHIARLASEAEQELNYLERELDRARQQKRFLSQQQETRRDERARLERRIEATQEGIKRRQKDVVRLENVVAEASMRLEELPVAEAAQQRKARQQEIEAVQTIVAGRQAVVESRSATLQQLDGQIRRLQTRLDRFKKEQSELDLAGVQEALASLESQMEDVDGQIAPLNSQREALQESLVELEDRLTQEQRKAHDLETNYTEAKVTLSQRENQLEGLVERISADLGLVALQFDEEQGGQTPLPIDEVVDRLPDVSELPPDIEKSIQEHRSQLQRIGSVNPDAPVEYEQTQERYEFLTQQIEDLKQTDKQLRRVIAELDDLTSRAFAETVEKVNGIFADLFEQLFGGGTAELVLTEPDDLTISGVDIICRLPNRRQQRIGLLSGGERSLTATALIFALLKVSPPPFCVMDEVDAMLDEANINRFRSVLRDLAQNSQFIVITHNRGTVQAARTVYGVSMGADSVSQVISIRPEEYVNGDQ
ncbi:MAG: chromosome segregation protein SMC, partial [Chloroflexota bacterium]